MNNIELIKQAIRLRKPVRFVYKEKDKNPGERIGNPHIVYFKDRFRHNDEIKVDLYQTEGASDSATKGEGKLPDWREFDLEKMEEISLLDSQIPFEVANDYKPNASRYAYFIAKI